MTHHAPVELTATPPHSTLWPAPTPHAERLPIPGWTAMHSPPLAVPGDELWLIPADRRSQPVHNPHATGQMPPSDRELSRVLSHPPGLPRHRAPAGGNDQPDCRAHAHAGRMRK